MCLKQNPKTANKTARLLRTVKNSGHGDGGIHGVGPALQQLQPRLRRLNACTYRIVVVGWNILE